MSKRLRVKRTVVIQGEILNDRHSRILVQEVTAEKIKKIVFEISGLKSPRPEGYIAYFFQEAWDVVGESIIKVVKSC